MTTPGDGSTRRPAPVRIKFGPRPYTQTHVCAYCRKPFEQGGFWIRMQQGEVDVDLPLCEPCLGRRALYEAVVPFDRPDPSFRVGLA